MQKIILKSFCHLNELFNPHLSRLPFFRDFKLTRLIFIMGFFVFFITKIVFSGVFSLGLLILFAFFFKILQLIKRLRKHIFSDFEARNIFLSWWYVVSFVKNNHGVIQIEFKKKSDLRIDEVVIRHKNYVSGVCPIF